MTQLPPNNSFRLKKAILLFWLVLSLILFPIHKSQAALWPSIDPIIKTALEKVVEMVQGMMMGMLKQAAVQAINKQMGSMIGGSNSKNAMFITNWADFLVQQPINQAGIYINDYISQTTKGTGSVSGYKPAGSEGVSNTSYASQLAQGATALTSEAPKTPQMTYTSDPSQMFSDGTFKSMSSYLSGVNNPWAYNLDVQSKYQQEIENQKQIAQTRAISYQGFTGTQKNGMIITPGSLTKEATANAQDLGNKIVAGATHMPEVLTAIVMQMATQSIQQGIGGIQSSIQKEVTSTASKATQQKNSQVQSQGPSVLYK